MMEPCPHYSPRVETGGWTLEVEGECAGLWVHAAADCRRPSQPTLDRLAGKPGTRLGEHAPVARIAEIEAELSAALPEDFIVKFDQRPVVPRVLMETEDRWTGTKR